MGAEMMVISFRNHDQLSDSQNTLLLSSFLGDRSEDGSVMDGGNNSNLQFMSINPVLSKRMFFV